MRPIHDRMPVILDPAAEEAWLAPDARQDDLLGLLVPAPAGLLEAREVGDHVSNVREDGPALIEPRAEATLF
jgi:putative SOS response-associated peptidase YedK